MPWSFGMASIILLLAFVGLAILSVRRPQNRVLTTASALLAVGTSIYIGSLGEVGVGTRVLVLGLVYLVAAGVYLVLMKRQADVA